MALRLGASVASNVSHRQESMDRKRMDVGFTAAGEFSVVTLVLPPALSPGTAVQCTATPIDYM
jgi:hypothetical protein